MTSFFHTILYQPIYNLLVFLVGIVPGEDLGLAVIAATLIIKIIIMPLSLSAVRTTRGMQALQPKLKEIQERLKDDKEAQAKETFALYKKYRINPFASILTLLIQLPILLALYFVVRSKELVAVDSSVLYSFVHAPTHVSVVFLGALALSRPDLILAALAAITQFFQALYAIPVPKKKEKASMQEEFGRAMALQARIVIPLIIGVISYTSGAIALYFITSNFLLLLQEFIVRRVPHPAEKDRNGESTLAVSEPTPT